MKHVLAAAGVALLLTACAKTELQSSIVPPEPLRDPIKLPFWLEDGKTGEDDPRIVDVDGHPCGSIAYLDVRSIPEPNAVVHVDSVVEFDASGRELMVWRSPTDFVVDEVQGDLLGISNNHGQSLWVDPIGRLFHRAQTPPRRVEPTACPRLQRFEKSEYLRCMSLKDARTGKSRLIAWQGVCS